MPINDKETFWIYGKHAVIAALENKNRKVIEVITNQEVTDLELKKKKFKYYFSQSNYK